MTQPILVVERITRVGNRPLGDFVATDDVVAKEAGIGRGLLIGDCLEDRLTGHVCYAVRNALPSKSVIVPFSYALSEEIAETLQMGHDLAVWQATRNSRKGKGNATASIQIAIPEKLFLVDKRVRDEAYRPSFIHVVDPPALLDRRNISITGALRYRASNVARHKAICEANGAIPYVLLWTTEGCGAFPQAHLCKVMGVDAWLYASGQTLRTAAFADLRTAEMLFTAKKSHWLDKWVHEAYISRSGIVVVCGGKNNNAQKDLRELAETHGYPIVDISQVVASDGIYGKKRSSEEIQRTIREAVHKHNRQVTVLTGTKSVWNTMDDTIALELFSQVSEFTTIVMAAPPDRSAKSLSLAASMLSKDKMRGLSPIIVDCSRQRN